MVIFCSVLFVTQPLSGDLDQSMLAPNIEVIDLYNRGSGLGFGIVGVRDIGIVVKTIVPGGAAEEVGNHLILLF